ncbi:MAG: hypothetical protein RR441_11660 [Longicatena sp.]
MKNFIRKQNLLQELANRLHIIYLSDLGLSTSAADLREVVAEIPVQQFEESEWYQAADYIAGSRGYKNPNFQSPAEAKRFLLNLRFE